MTTAMVSAFYDVGDVLFQSRKNFLLHQQASASSQQASVQQVSSRAMHTPSQPMHAESRRIIGAQQQLSSLSQRIEAQRMVTKSPEPCQMSSQMAQNQMNMLANLHNNQQCMPSDVMNLANLHNSQQCMPGDVSPVFGMSDFQQAIPHSREITGRRLDRTMSEPLMFQSDLPLSPGAGSLSGLSDNQKPIAQTNMNPSRYKTESCRPFEENGHCKYGDKCQFAHGGHELRSLSRHPKYKTELCRTFHTIGFCPYGPRCHFIHNEDLRRLNMINQQKQQQATSVSQQSSPIAGSLPMMAQSQPSMITRPRALSFNLHSLAGHHQYNARDSLGSVADSPPSSVSVSPTMSPNFLEEYVMESNDVFTPQSAPAGSINNMFNFPTSDDMLMQRAAHQAAHNQQTLNQHALNMHAQQTHAQQTQQKQSQAAEEAVALANLANSLHALSIQRARESGVTAPGMTLADLQAALVPGPPSPPESISGDSGVSSGSGGMPSTASSCGSPLEVSRNLRLPIFSQLSNRD